MLVPRPRPAAEPKRISNFASPERYGLGPVRDRSRTRRVCDSNGGANAHDPDSACIRFAMHGDDADGDDACGHEDSLDAISVPAPPLQVRHPTRQRQGRPARRECRIHCSQRRQPLRQACLRLPMPRCLPLQTGPRETVFCPSFTSLANANGASEPTRYPLRRCHLLGWRQELCPATAVLGHFNTATAACPCSERAQSRECATGRAVPTSWFMG